MTFHVPQTVADNLFEDIEQWIDLDETPDELSLQKLERLASALAKVEPALASIAKSAIAVIRWDFEEADRWAKNAMLLDSSPIMLLNVALTYKLLNRLDLAADVGRVLYSKAPKDADVVNAALGYLTWGGYLHDVNRICAEAQGNGVALLADNEDMTAYTNCMGELGISTERLIFEVNALYTHIVKDPRHKDVVVLAYEEITERRFGGWTMGQVRLDKLNPSIVLKYSETPELDPYGVSGSVSFALLEELMATAAILGRA